jgi:hypothetical protein
MPHLWSAANVLDDIGEIGRPLNPHCISPQAFTCIMPQLQLWKTARRRIREIKAPSLQALLLKHTLRLAEILLTNHGQNSTEFNYNLSLPSEP